MPSERLPEHIDLDCGCLRTSQRRAATFLLVRRAGQAVLDGCLVEPVPDRVIATRYPNP